MQLESDDLAKHAKLFHYYSSYPNFFEPDTQGFRLKKIERLRGDKDNSSLKLERPTLSSDLMKSIQLRRSCRDFGPSSLNINEISNLLWAANGVVSNNEEPESRTHPSAGALFSIKVFFLFNDKDGLKPGWHYYDYNQHASVFLRGMNDREKVSDYLRAKHIDYNQTSMVMFLYANIEQCCKKYGERGYRYLLIEAGHMAQNVCLASSFFSIPCVPVGGFDDSKVNQVISKFGVQGSALYSLVIGKKHD